MNLSQRERELIRHCVGFDGRNKTTYRNHFVIAPGCTDYDTWVSLASRGPAHHRSGEAMGALSGGQDCFWVTRAAALAVRNRDEHLSPDFRE